jgi:hypothetical protein
MRAVLQLVRTLWCKRQALPRALWTTLALDEMREAVEEVREAGQAAAEAGQATAEGVHRVHQKHWIWWSPCRSE